MAISLKSITRGRAERAPRILLGGVQKIGKSTWASGAPDPVFIPIIQEEGLDEIYAAKMPLVTSYGELIESLSALITEDHKYKTVAIDSLSSLEPLIWDHTCVEHGLKPGQIEQVLKGYGKGYTESLKHWRDILAALDFLRNEKGMGCVLIAHTRVKAFNDPLTDPYDQYQIALQKDAAELIERWADGILFANRKAFSKQVTEGKGDKKTTHATGTGDRFIYTDKRPAHFGGTRYPGMPYELPFNYQAFADAIAAARKTAA